MLGRHIANGRSLSAIPTRAFSRFVSSAAELLLAQLSRVLTIWTAPSVLPFVAKTGGVVVPIADLHEGTCCQLPPGVIAKATPRQNCGVRTQVVVAVVVVVFVVVVASQPNKSLPFLPLSHVSHPTPPISPTTSLFPYPPPSHSPHAYSTPTTPVSACLMLAYPDI